MRKLLPYIAVFCCLLLTNCSNNDDPAATTGLLDVTSELLSFDYVQDTGNNSSRLRYRVEFSNPNFQIVQGIYRITLNIDGTESTTVSNTQSQCATILGNSTCSISFNEESPHINGIPNSIEFVSAVYTITE
jgi:hypothetical protein